MQDTLTWAGVQNAASYQIFRIHGAMGCNQGEVFLGEVTYSLSFTDTGLQNGLRYYYIVIPKGINVANFGPASGYADAASIMDISSIPVPLFYEMPAHSSFLLVFSFFSCVAVSPVVSAPTTSPTTSSAASPTDAP